MSQAEDAGRSPARPRPNLKLGLRFAQGEATRLRSIVDQLHAERRAAEDIHLFEKAAESAEQDEPLILVCTHAEEAERVAHGFTRWGIQRPAIDQLNG